MEDWWVPGIMFILLLPTVYFYNLLMDSEKGRSNLTFKLYEALMNGCRKKIRQIRQTSIDDKEQTEEWDPNDQ